MESLLNAFGRQTTHHIGELSEIAAARRAGNDIARKLGFDEVRTGQVALVITEAATNIVKHAREGEILLRSRHSGGCAGVEIIALDRGPGIANVDLRMVDGSSSTGTYGVGLGAIVRLASEFDIYTVVGQGTVLAMTVWASDTAAAHHAEWEFGAVCLPLAGEDVCGDAFEVCCHPGGAIVAMADGLGHGPDAALASEAAVELVLTRPNHTPGEIMHLAHEALRGTRGAAMAVASIDFDQERLTFSGIGNIAGSVFQAGPRRHLMSHNGIVGSNLRKVQEFVHPWQPGALMIMHSDGIGTRWDLSAYPALERRHPTLIAAVLYRDFARVRDDATILVVRQHQEDA
jgi:anti-sigma regulatory factor (Ser/Thr protein kinase)